MNCSEVLKAFCLLTYSPRGKYGWYQHRGRSQYTEDKALQLSLNDYEHTYATRLFGRMLKQSFNMLSCVKSIDTYI